MFLWVRNIRDNCIVLFMTRKTCSFVEQLSWIFNEFVHFWNIEYICWHCKWMYACMSLCMQNAIKHSFSNSSRMGSFSLIQALIRCWAKKSVTALQREIWSTRISSMGIVRYWGLLLVQDAHVMSFWSSLGLLCPSLILLFKIWWSLN